MNMTLDAQSKYILDLHLISSFASFRNLTNFKMRSGSTEDTACVDVAAVTKYLNRIDVRVALHVDERIEKWKICDSKPHQYKQQYLDIFGEIQFLGKFFFFIAEYESQKELVPIGLETFFVGSKKLSC